MYKATLSFTTTNYDIRKNQIIDDSLIAEIGMTQAEITEYLEIGYLVDYDGTLEITQNGLYDVEGYEQADVDVPSGEPTLQNKSETITENKTTTIQADEGYDGLGTVTVTTNVSGGADLSDYFTDTVSSGIASGANQHSGLGASIKKLPSSMRIEGTSGTALFAFSYALVDVDVLDTSHLTNLTDAFKSCFKLSNDSLNNIMRMCINATNYAPSQPKTLQGIGLSSAQATTCQGLSNYQDFIDAGWTTGY